MTNIISLLRRELMRSDEKYPQPEAKVLIDAI
jgi:hypothetical protein